MDPYPYGGSRRGGDTAVHVEVAGVKLVFVARIWQKMVVLLSQHAIGDSNKLLVAMMQGEVEQGELGWIATPRSTPAKPAVRVKTSEPPPESIDNEGDLEEDDQ